MQTNIDGNILNRAHFPMFVLKFTQNFLKLYLLNTKMSFVC